MQSPPACERIDPAWHRRGVRTQSHRHVPRTQVYSFSVTARGEMWPCALCRDLAVHSRLIIVLLKPPSSKTTKLAPAPFLPSKRTQNSRPNDARFESFQPVAERRNQVLQKVLYCGSSRWGKTEGGQHGKSSQL